MKKSSSNYFTTRGIILDSMLVRESDRMVSVLTEDRGRVRAVAPGAQKISARLLGATEPAVESTLTFYDNAGGSYVARITGGVVLRTFPEIRRDLEKFLVTSKILEIINSMMPERQPNAHKYSLVARTLELLETTGNARRIYLAFVLRFLKMCGWGLELGVCIKCGDSVISHFSLGEKGVLCGKCAGPAPGRDCFPSPPAGGYMSVCAAGDTGFGGEALSFLRKIARKPGSEIESIAVSAGIEKKVAEAVESYLNEYIPRPLKSGLFV